MCCYFLNSIDVTEGNFGKTEVFARELLSFQNLAEEAIDISVDAASLASSVDRLEAIIKGGDILNASIELRSETKTMKAKMDTQNEVHQGEE